MLGGGYGPSPRRRGSGNMVTHMITAVLGAALAAGLLLFNQFAFGQDLNMFGYGLAATVEMFGNGVGRQRLQG